MDQSRHPVLWGAVILTSAGILSRIIGFFYRIFLSHTIGAEGMGIYQLVFPVYSLSFAVTVFGIQTALSRLVASEKAQHHSQRANDYFLLGTAFSCLLSLLVACFLHRKADWIAARFLLTPQTAPLLKLLSYSIPPAVFHACVNSYYFAHKKAKIPALSQLLEQLVRVGASYVVFQIFSSENRTMDAGIPLLGMLFGELFSMIFALLVISLDLHRQRYLFSRLTKPVEKLREILHLSLPLTCNRVLITLLSSMEQILIPNRLLAFGLTSREAFRLFGVLSGMTMPLLLFPSAITNSLSVMLLPSIAEHQALGNVKKIQDSSRKALGGCGLLGCGCMVLFFLFGRPMGVFLFHSALAGTFLKCLSLICPFLYLNVTLTGILNGLGKTNITFRHSLIALGVRMSFLVFTIPVCGIKGYLWGILCGELLLSGLNYRSLCLEIRRVPPET